MIEMAGKFEPYEDPGKLWKAPFRLPKIVHYIQHYPSYFVQIEPW
jgi:hypothetical protein